MQWSIKAVKLSDFKVHKRTHMFVMCQCVARQGSFQGNLRFVHENKIGDLKKKKIPFYFGVLGTESRPTTDDAGEGTS